MKQIFKIIALTLALATTPLLAGAGAPGHSHEKITEQKAINIAKSMKNGLVKKGTLKDSWEMVDYSEVKQKKFGKNLEWLVTFNNPKIEDKSKQTLYIFMSLYGQVTGANYTGN
ncbi:DUF6488 family protein [Halarcobacter bivalviorum]|uniref:DUF6488 family protein n=1 Tax=Halarcobacter bivalviorum TaxID=663364 RepID=UPI00100A99E0|nr:DUF6488 family protein [Halarcobacter bivalviorum]RXK03345.1 hypothetical protein CRU97_12540 [Halarcobacter bivalviorum]